MVVEIITFIILTIISLLIILAIIGIVYYFLKSVSEGADFDKDF